MVKIYFITFPTIQSPGAHAHAHRAYVLLWRPAPMSVLLQLRRVKKWIWGELGRPGGKDDGWEASGRWRRWRWPGQVEAGTSRPFDRVGEKSSGRRGEGKREAATDVVGSRRSFAAVELRRDPTTPRRGGGWWAVGGGGASGELTGLRASGRKRLEEE